MLTIDSPEAIARAVVAGFTGDEYWIDTNKAANAIAVVIAAERARYEPAMRSFVATWEDGTVMDAAVLRRFVRLFRDALG